jgi:hypothetical protein
MRRLKRVWGQSITNKIAIILAVIFLIVVVGGYSGSWYFGWTGLADYTRPPGVDERGKTLWDWLELLIIPAVLAGGAMWFSRAEREAERGIADDRLREAALQTYLDRMTHLLLEKELRTSKEEDEAHAVARARTLTVLRQLDGERKGTVLRFLSEARVISKSDPIVDLEGADLSKANLHKASLSAVNLCKVDLSKADLSEAMLYEADLHKADLRGVDLRSAIVLGANLDAELSGAKLTGIKYSKNTTWPPGFTIPSDAIEKDTFDLYKR